MNLTIIRGNWIDNESAQKHRIKQEVSGMKSKEYTARNQWLNN